MQKRGSLQLSINAIVILVMAMVILGLGLTFIRGLFERGTENLGRAIDNADLENPANAQNPLTIDKNVQVKQGDSARFKVGYYNSGSGSVTARPGPPGGTNTPGAQNVNCPGRADGATTAAPTTDIVFSFTSITADVPPNTAVAFEAIITPTSTVQPGVYVCPIQILAGNDLGPSGQLHITVTS